LTRGFSNVEWKWSDRWTLHGAAMIERNTNAKAAWSPKVALTYEPFIGHVFRVGSSRAQRTPTLFEKYVNYYFDTPSYVSPVNPLVAIPPARLQIQMSRGGPNSESILSHEIGYAFSLPNSRLSGDMRWFSDRLGGLVGQINNGGVTFINMDDVYVRGGDLTLNWLPRAGTRLRMAFSKTKIYANDQGGTYSISAPDNTVSLFLGQSLAYGLEFSANYQRVGAMFWTDAGSPKRPIAPIEHLNLRLAKAYHFGANRAEAALVVQEALGNHHAYYLSTPKTIASRLASVQLSLDF
jgi:outer membrane receptor protein involved in Fe transport